MNEVLLVVSNHSRENLLLNRVRRIHGQVEAIERALEQEIGCADVLQVITATRGAINGLIGEVIEDHIRIHLLSGMNDRVQHQTLHVDENMSFLAFRAPFSALLTLWLSMMQAVGLASRSASSRHSTYSARGRRDAR